MTGLPGGTPREALGLAAAPLAGEGLEDELDARFDGRSDALTLRALVEIAGEIGLAPEAFEAEWDDLAARSGPAVLHLKDGDRASFTVVTGASARRATLLDEDGAERAVARERIEPRWSGVVVFLSDPGGDAARRARAARRVARDPRALAGVAAAVAVFCAALVSAWRFGGGSAPATAAALSAVVLAACGAGVSYVLFAASRRGRAGAALPRLARAVCGQGRFTDCGAVLSSRWSSVLGIDLPSYGLSFFASVIVVLASGAFAAGHALEAAWLSAGVFCLLAAPAALVLVAIQVWPLRRICPLCMAVHAIVLGGAGGALAMLATGGGGAGAGPLAAAGSIQAVAFFGALGLLVPDLEARMERAALNERVRRVFATPLGAIADLAGSRPILAPRDAGVMLGDAAGDVRLDAFVHPLCEHCPAFLDDLETLIETSPATLRAALHFPARDLASAADGALMTALYAVGIASGGAAALAAFRDVEREPWRWLDAAQEHGESVASRLAPEVAPQEDALARARVLAREDTDAVQRLGLATPALLVAGRVWDAPLTHLGDAVERHGALLREAAGLPARGRSSKIA